MKTPELDCWLRAAYEKAEKTRAGYQAWAAAAHKHWDAKAGRRVVQHAMTRTWSRLDLRVDPTVPCLSVEEVLVQLGTDPVSRVLKVFETPESWPYRGPLLLEKHFLRSLGVAQAQWPRLHTDARLAKYCLQLRQTGAWIWGQAEAIKGLRSRGGAR
jgi:hypothetical protein